MDTKVLDCDGVPLELALIPAGKFMMGSKEGDKGYDCDEGPQHEVTISKPFYMGIFAVKQDQYKAVMGKNLSAFTDDDNPVENVTWYDAQAFCDAVSEKTGRTVRLPTEAEWEYACRAGTATQFSHGDSDRDLGDYAWYMYSGKTGPHTVGQLLHNGWELYDMHGNVHEWCSDWYASDYYAKSNNIDPKGPCSGSSRVLRGGSWFHGFWYCRSATRHSSESEAYYNVGFRVVAEAQP